MPEHGTKLEALQQELGRMAADTFETKGEAAQWLRRPHPMLGEESPLHTAQTEAGVHRVKAILVAIKYGGVV